MRLFTGRPVTGARAMLGALAIALIGPISGASQAVLAADNPAPVKAYFLHIDGRALPVKQVLVNGVNVLGGAVVSLSLPVNISGYTKAGLNTLQVDYVSDPKSNLLVSVEKRTPGPKSEELAKIATTVEASNEVKSATISFNLPEDGGAASVGALNDLDRASINEEFEHYYQALASAKADQVRGLYKQSLSEERKLSPENAHFFDNVLTREVQILKNKDLKLQPLNRDGLAYKVEGDVVKLYRHDARPLIESNEVVAKIAPILIEVGGKGQSPVKAASTDNVGDKDKDIEIPSEAFTSGEKQGGKLLEVRGSDGSVLATEIPVKAEAPTEKIEKPLFDGSLPAVSDSPQDLPKKNTKKPSKKESEKQAKLARAEAENSAKTAVKERLVRFNLYFKPSKADSSGKRSWAVSLPPNV
jgi:hypothetical protein